MDGRELYFRIDVKLLYFTFVNILCQTLPDFLALFADLPYTIQDYALWAGSVGNAVHLRRGDPLINARYRCAGNGEAAGRKRRQI